MKTSICRGKEGAPGCGASIIWATTRTGSKMPLDAEPDPEGMFVIEMDGDEPFAIHVGVFKDISAPRYTSHFATCPQAESFRR